MMRDTLECHERLKPLKADRRQEQPGPSSVPRTESIGKLPSKVVLSHEPVARGSIA